MILVYNARILYVIYTVFWHVGHVFPAFLHQHPHRIGRTVWMSDKDSSPATISTQTDSRFDSILKSVLLFSRETVILLIKSSTTRCELHPKR